MHAIEQLKYNTDKKEREARRYTTDTHQQGLASCLPNPVYSAMFQNSLGIFAWQ